MTTTEIKETELEALSNKVMSDIGGAFGLLMAYRGDQARVYQILEKLALLLLNKRESMHAICWNGCLHETLTNMVLEVRI